MATVLFSGGLANSDPVTSPVIVVGQVRHLNRVDWDTIKVKLEPRVTKEVCPTKIILKLIAFLSLVVDSRSSQPVPLSH